jgi:hypothetical protein
MKAFFADKFAALQKYSQPKSQATLLIGSFTSFARLSDTCQLALLKCEQLNTSMQTPSELEGKNHADGDSGCCFF